MPAFEWVHVQLHQQKGMISLSPPTICNSARYRDHDLSGDWAGYRECYIKPDLLLIYRKSDADTLRLARLGSHSELFG
ncbi:MULTISPECIES: type II toxin-antitoxin system YafQ family toxin [Enterobacteriaceae]|uniref:type II toxin-antitoxin system YafQ family toxin n=1 Tax=Enterobacteriaceae TaxID=543 RepID=UPI00202312D2|nr:type II toxin-antitoxin system YafQ family toxin [Escherichia coli]